MLRSEIPIISAACPHVIRFAIARKITSCTFIARSQATSEYFGILPPTSRMPQLQAPFSGQITCYLNRTDDMLTTQYEIDTCQPARIGIASAAKPIWEVGISLRIGRFLGMHRRASERL